MDGIDNDNGEVCEWPAGPGPYEHPKGYKDEEAVAVRSAINGRRQTAAAEGSSESTSEEGYTPPGTGDR